MGGCTSAGAAAAAAPAVRVPAPRPAVQPETRCLELPADERIHLAPQEKLTDMYTLSQDVLGDGLSGQIRLARCQRSGARVAVKSFDIRQASPEELAFIESETRNFLLADHPHIVRLLGVYISETQLDLVMECMDGGELFDRVKSQKRLSVEHARYIMFQALLAVNHLHSLGITHCDIKLENLLCERADEHVVKLCDFGFSQLCGPGEILTQRMGSPNYISPCVLQRHYTSQCDLWSLGVAAYIMLTGKVPFHGPDRESRILKGQFDQDRLLVEFGELPLDFIQRLLTVDPAKRLTAAQALEHPWIKEHDSSRNTGAVALPVLLGNTRRPRPGKSGKSGKSDKPENFFEDLLVNRMMKDMVASAE